MLLRRFKAANIGFSSNTRTKLTSAVNVSRHDQLIWHSPGGKNCSDFSVIVCGWGGSKRHFVEKYTNLFSKDLGLHSTGCILPMETLFCFDKIAQREFSIEVLDLLSSKSTLGKKTPLLVLSLSNNGAMVCQHLVDLCKNEYQDQFRIQGVILDSAPGPFTWLGYAVSRFNLRSRKNLQPFLNTGKSNTYKFLRPFWTGILYYYIEALDSDKSRMERIQNTWKVLNQFKVNWDLYAKTLPWPGDYFLHEKESWPILFLYSDADKLMPSRFIELVIDRQKSFGRTIFTHKFVGSPHVAHLKHFPREYTEVVLNFIQHLQSTNSRINKNLL